MYNPLGFIFMTEYKMKILKGNLHEIIKLKLKAIKKKIMNISIKLINFKIKMYLLKLLHIIIHYERFNIRLMFKIYFISVCNFHLIIFKCFMLFKDY